MAKQQRSNGRRRDGQSDVGEPTLVAAVATRGPAGWLAVGLPALLAVACYLPACDYGLLDWDDGSFVCENPQINRPGGLRSIWCDVLTYDDPAFDRVGSGAYAKNYYPVTYTSFWLDFRILTWFSGADANETVCANIAAGRITPMIFHAHNVLLHAVNASLLVLALRRLGASAWVSVLACILFAVHPAQAATVAWVIARKNLLSLLFMLVTLILYIDFRRHGGWYRYALALLMFAGALFAKTIAVTWPLVLFASDRVLDGGWTWRGVRGSLGRVWPMLGLSLAAGIVTLIQEQRGVDSALVGFERCLLVPATVLYYPWRLVWLSGQSPIYPLWDLDPASPFWYACMLACGGLGWAYRHYRKRVPAMVAWALFAYVITISPLLGVVNANYFKFAFVADHFMYHASIGLFFVAAFAIEATWRHYPRPSAIGRCLRVLAVAWIVGLAVRTFVYSDVYRDSGTFWRHVLLRDPNRWAAYNRLTRQAVADIEAAKEAGEVVRAEAVYAEARRRAGVGLARYGAFLQPYRERIESAVRRAAYRDAIGIAAAAARRSAHANRFHLQCVQLHQAAGDWPEAARVADLAMHRFPTSEPLARGILELAREAGDTQRVDVCMEQIHRIHAIQTPEQMARMLAGGPGDP